MDRYLLQSVSDKKTNEKIFLKLEGRVCSVTFENNYTEMIIKFDNGGTLKHFEKIEKIEEDYNGLWVSTSKKLWRFNYYK